MSYSEGNGVKTSSMWIWGDTVQSVTETELGGAGLQLYKDLIHFQLR